MLRLLVLLLLLANLGYFAWSHGLLRSYGFAPTAQNEPQRLAQQIRPGQLRILSSDEVRTAGATAPAAGKPAQCLQSAVLDEVQAEAVRLAAQATLPAGSWALDTVVEPVRWIVYMGKYPDAQTLVKKRSELAALNLRFEPLTNPALGFGLSLGGFDSEANARAALVSLSQRGVKTAAVVQERAELRGSVFKLPLADDTLRGLLDALKPALGERGLRSCP